MTDCVCGCVRVCAQITKLPYDAAAEASAEAEESAKGPYAQGYSVEKVNNVMGSTAGAGSGDFHHYRHTRRCVGGAVRCVRRVPREPSLTCVYVCTVHVHRREMARLAAIEQDAEETERDDEFRDRVEKKRKECEQRTKKNAEVHPCCAQSGCCEPGVAFAPYVGGWCGSSASVHVYVCVCVHTFDTDGSDLTHVDTGRWRYGVLWCGQKRRRKRQRKRGSTHDAGKKGAEDGGEESEGEEGGHEFSYVPLHM